MQLTFLLLIAGLTASSIAQDVFPELREEADYLDLAPFPAMQQDLYGGVWDSDLPLSSELVYVEDERVVKRGRRGGGKREGGDQRYECRPSRDDVVRLLLALHDARGGNSARTVNFCNRRRPAMSILTNLRFIGRRR